MFTGIIEETGTIKSIVSVPEGKKFTISAERILSDLSVEDSVSISGVCLTVEDTGKDFFKATAVKETLTRSNLGVIQPGVEVNLERAMRFNKRFGGHFVYGHIDGTGKILSISLRAKSRDIGIMIPEDLMKYMIIKGSAALDGISLTIAGIDGNIIMVSVIPYTMENTTLCLKKIGDKVNIEVDIIGKYIENFLVSEDRIVKYRDKLKDFLK